MLRWCKKCKRIVKTEKHKEFNLERCTKCGTVIIIKNKFKKYKGRK